MPTNRLRAGSMPQLIWIKIGLASINLLLDTHIVGAWFVSTVKYDYHPNWTMQSPLTNYLYLKQNPRKKQDKNCSGKRNDDIFQCDIRIKRRMHLSAHECSCYMHSCSCISSYIRMTVRTNQTQEVCLVQLQCMSMIKTKI